MLRNNCEFEIDFRKKAYTISLISTCAVICKHRYSFSYQGSFDKFSNYCIHAEVQGEASQVTTLQPLSCHIPLT
jgi:hypothetical protein